MSQRLESELGGKGDSKGEKTLQEATTEYKNNPTSPEALTQFMRAFWAEAGQRIGKNIAVDNFPLTVREIKEKAKEGQMAIFVPDGVNRVDLGKMFPKMGSWAVKENSIVDVINNYGWLWVEASVEAPNRNTTQTELEEKFKKEGKQGQPLRTYIIGGQISKLLTDKYFDEGSTWSRLLGSCVGCRVLYSLFRSDGRLDVGSLLRSWLRVGSLGGRSEEVIKL